MEHPTNAETGKIYGEPVVQCGLDIGKVHDPSVLAITEVQRIYLGLVPGGENPSYYDEDGGYHPSVPRFLAQWETRYIVRHMEAMPLETPYHTIASRVAEVFCSSAVPRVLQRSLYVDATGVGNGVVEMVQKALKEQAGSQDVRLYPITLTYGTKAYELGARTVSKHALVSQLILLMDTNTLLVPRELQDLMPLVDELKTFQVRLSEETANQSFGGKPGTHDDRVISLGLSTIVDPFKYRVTYSQRVY